MSLHVLLVNLWSKGGMVHYTSQLANALARVHQDVSLRLLISNRARRDLLDRQIPVSMLAVPGGVSRADVPALLLQPVNFPRLWAHLRKPKYDIVHINSHHPWTTVLLPLLHRKVRIVTTLHNVHSHPGEETLRSRLGAYNVVRYAHAIFVHGQELKRILVEDLGADPDKIHTVPHGEYTFFTQLGDPHVSEEDSTVLFFGRILKYKGLEYLLQAVPLMTERLPNLKVIIAGGGDLKPYQRLINQYTKYLEIHNRYLPEEEVSDLFRRAAVVVLPYIEASQSGIVPIAFAFRKSVVATDVGCLADVVSDGITGYLIPPRTPELLADRCVRLLTNPNERRKMGERACEKMREELNWDQIALKTVEVYRAVLDSWQHAQ